MKTHRPTFTRIWYDSERQGFMIRMEHRYFKGGYRSGKEPTSQATHLFFNHGRYWTTVDWVPINRNGPFWKNHFPEGLDIALEGFALKAGFPGRRTMLKHVQESGLPLDVPLTLGIEEPPHPTIYDHLDDE
jgi:hypothetical protein